MISYNSGVEEAMLHWSGNQQEKQRVAVYLWHHNRNPLNDMCVYAVIKI